MIYSSTIFLKWFGASITFINIQIWQVVSGTMPCWLSFTVQTVMQERLSCEWSILPLVAKACFSVCEGGQPRISWPANQPLPRRNSFTLEGWIWTTCLASLEVRNRIFGGVALPWVVCMRQTIEFDNDQSGVDGPIGSNWCGLRRRFSHVSFSVCHSNT